jgi:hypothetical protein
MGERMVERAGEVIRVGSSRARIVRVTLERIEYLDMAGQDQVIDLKECARNWVQWSKGHDGDLVPVSGASQEEVDNWNARCLGQRGGTYYQWVEFMNERKTRFEFETWEARLKELQGPLMVAGWNTFDTE